MENWFKEPEIFFEEFSDKFTLGYQIHKGPQDILPATNTCVLIGIDERISNSIRKELYKTSFPFDNIYLADLGNLRNTNPEFSIAVLNDLLSKEVNVIVLGMDDSHITTQLRSLQKFIHNVAFIEKAGEFFLSDNIQKLLTSEDNIDRAKLIGYQTHLLNPEKLNHKKFNQSLRLGKFRNNYKEAEPILRDVEWSFFNMDSIRYSEVPGIKNTSPSGLTSEESCQIMKYLGLNSENNLINIYGYDPKFDFHGQGAMMVSQLIWYYLEGLDQMIIDNIEDKSFISTYVVELADYDTSLIFYRSKKTGRWWVEIPAIGDSSSFLLPCSLQDYEKATKNELSYRIFSELGL